MAQDYTYFYLKQCLEALTLNPQLLVNLKLQDCIECEGEMQYVCMGQSFIF